MPSRAAMRIRVRAVDPDYALSKVVVETRPEGSGVIRDKVLWQPGATENQTNGDGEVRVSTRIVPVEEAPGAQVIEYRAVVYDNRKPEPNSTATTWRRLIVDEQSPSPKEPEELWPDKKPGPTSEKDSSREVVNGSNGKNFSEEKPAQPKDTPGKQNSDSESHPQQQTSETMSEDNAEEKDQNASGSAGGQEGQGRQSGMSAEGNGGVNGEAQTATNEGESSANGSDKNQGTQSTQDGSGQSKSGSQQRDMGDESLSQKDEGGQAQGQPRSDAKGNRDAMEADPLSADGMDDGEAIERILENKRRKSDGGGSQSGR